MTLNIYPKLAPMPGMTGMGGGPTGLPLGGAAALLVPFYGARGVYFGAFYESGNTRTWTHIDYSDITGGGNASDFGDMTTDERERFIDTLIKIKTNLLNVDAHRASGS